MSTSPNDQNVLPLTTETHNMKHPLLREMKAGQDIRPEHGEDISRAGGIFAALQTSSKLTNRHQNVDVVAADKVLRQIDDSCH